MTTWGSEQSCELGHLNMKTYNNLYDKVCSMGNLYRAFRKAKKRKSTKPYVINFEKNLAKNLVQLQKELKTQTYKPKPLKTFIIRDPKTRVISASDFRDRVVHHAICNIIEPIFEKTVIHDSYANRKGKGTHKALERFDCFKRKITKNGRLVKNPKSANMIIGYALKCDIKQYFPSVDHDIMINLLGRKVRDKKLIWLLKQIIENHSGKELRKGMPIGNLTSQYFANIYLHELDIFVKHELKAKYYLRYLDDFLILERSKDKLKIYKQQITRFLKTIRLELHTEKSKIIPLHKGINLLGFRVFYYHKLLKKSNMRLVRKRIEDFKTLYKYRYITKEKVAESMRSWCAFARWGNTYKLRANIEKDVNNVFLRNNSKKLFK